MAKYFQIPFAMNGDRKEIPTDKQGDGSISFDEGYGADYEKNKQVDPTAKDISRQEFNSVLHDMTDAIGEIQRSGVATWTNEISYSKGATIIHSGAVYTSTINFNKNEPPHATWSSLDLSEYRKKNDLSYGDGRILTDSDIVSEWGDSLDKTLSQNFLSKSFKTINSKMFCVTPEQFGAVGDGVADDTPAIQSAINTGLKVILSKIYKVTQELEIKTVGQTIEFTNSIYGYGDNSLSLASGNCYLKPVGSNFRKAVRTYRNWRGSASDPSDAPFSVVINVQAEGIKLINPTIKLEATESVDVGIFCGSRVGVAIFNPVVLGYFRKASMYYDVSQAHGLHRHFALDGTRYDQGSVRSGADGCSLHNPTLIGGNIGLAVLGAKFEGGKNDYGKYYDEAKGLINDGRGSFGFSDFTVFGGRVYSTDKEGRTRTADPLVDSSGNLSQALMEQENDFSPASMYVDGICANASKSLWGMRFFSTRFATYEMFRVRLGRCSRMSFYSTHIEGRGGAVKDTQGNAIDSNDTVKRSYGDISGTSNTGSIIVTDCVRNAAQTLLPHFYGESYEVLTASGANFKSSNNYTYGKNFLDLRADSGFRCRLNNVTLLSITASGISPNPTGALSLGSDNNLFRNIYLANQPIVTSDKRKKNNVEYISYKYLQVIGNMNFKQYYMNECDKLCFGIIAQDWIESCNKFGVDPFESNVLVGSDENGYAVRYGELQNLFNAYILTKLK